MTTVDALVEDLNGDHYLGTQEGETLVTDEPNVYIFPNGVPSAANPLEKVQLDKNQVTSFLSLNFTYLKAQIPTIFDKDAAIIAYHRMMAVAEGLVSPHFQEANFFVKYSEARELTNEKTVEAVAAKEYKALNSFMAYLTPEIRKDIKDTFVDRVCLVAFVFRARGHHYTNEYQDLYTRVWGKCRYKPENLHITFQHLATVALHAVYPIILDNFWSASVTGSRANGALCKRFDVAPAGMAGPSVLRQGVQDLLMIAPGIRNRLEDSMKYLDDLHQQMLANRYNGSVNARYYNAKRIGVDEKKLSAIAATIYAAVKALAPEAPIANSPALQRIANNAPITGAVLGRAIGTIANRSEVVDPLLIEPVSNSP
jgi:hypothetical protein